MTIPDRFCIGAVLALSATGALGQARYTVTDLGDLGGGISYAFSINNAGQVVGKSRTATGNMHACLFDGVSLVDLGTLPGGQTSMASAINDAGRVVGFATGTVDAGDGTLRTISHAVLWNEGVATDLTPDLPADQTSAAVGINAAGAVSGYMYQGRQYPFIRTASGFQWLDVNLIGGTDCEIGGMSDAGQAFINVWGPSYDRAFLWDGVAVADLGGVGSADNYPLCINMNGSGSIAGAAQVTNEAFVYQGGTFTNIGAAALPGTSSEAAGVNVAGDVVGYFFPGGPAHGFIYQGGVLTDLNTLIDPSSGWLITFAVAISDSGQIAGYGISPQGLNHAFLLTPVPPCEGPGISAEPAPVFACGAGPALFTVGASGTGPLSYQWQIEDAASGGWIDLAEGTLNRPAGDVLAAAGTQTPMLLLTDIVPALLQTLGSTRAHLRCVVTSDCGSAESQEATLTVSSADFNGDGDIGTDGDIEAFFACLAGNCCDTCGSADFNRDGDIGTDADIESFFRVLAGGGC